MYSRLYYILYILLACSITTYGQTEINKLNQSRFFSFAPGIHTNGFGINFKWSRFADQSRFTYYSIDIGRIKHKKEFRYLGNGRYNGFVFGRKNIAMPVRFGIGKYYILGVRNNKNDVGVSCTYQGGISMAMLKPVYLYLMENPGNVNSDDILVKYNGESNIDVATIRGGAPFFNGFNQLQLVPGAYGKAALLFSWGKYYSDYHVLEVGFLTEVFTKELPLMANTSNNFIYPSFYVNFNMGKLW